MYRPNKFKILAISSSGGHLDQLIKILEYFDSDDVLLGTFNKSDAHEKVKLYEHFWLRYPTNRNIANNILNLCKGLVIEVRFSPKVYISTGAASAVVFAIIARVFRKKFIYVEPIDRIKLPTLTAKLLMLMGVDIYVYWDSQLKNYKKRVQI